MATIPQGLVLSFDPAESRLIYVAGHPVDLWTATIDGHELVKRHLLIQRSQVAPAAW